MKLSSEQVKRIGGGSLEIALGIFLLTMLVTAWKAPASQTSSVEKTSKVKMKAAGVSTEALLPVQGTTACILTCPPSVTIPNDANQCGANVSYSPPTMTGNCATAPICSPATGAFFPVGTTTVTCSSLDSSLVGPAPACNLIYGLTSCNRIIKSDALSGAGVGFKFVITGLQPGETIIGIDFRPATGQLYGLGSTSRLYVINTTTGAATAVSATPFTPALIGTAFGFDFNPTVDRIRAVSDADQNLRLNPITGTVAGTDTNLTYAPGDPNFNQNPNIVGLAYTNNFFGSTSTTLYGIDSNLDVLVTLGGLNSIPSPNSGQLFTVGALGINTSDLVGFDISACDGTAYAALTSDGVTRLYRINLATGAATLVGVLPLSTLDCGPTGTYIDIAVGFLVSSCSFTVTVNDTQPPTITCPGGVSSGSAITCPPTTDGTVTYTTPSVAAGTVTDNCPGVTAVCSPPSGSIFPVGTTTVTCTATDASGNTATCTFTVNQFNACIQDDSNPGNVILFNTTTGEYRVCCNGLVVATGTGTVINQGCDFTLQSNSTTHRLLAKWSSVYFRGSGALQMPPGSIKCTLMDRDIRNNTCNCGT